MKGLATVAGCLGFALAACGAGDAGGSGNVTAAAPGPADPAPAFSLTGSDGRVHALADHLDHRAVVLAWFPKAFTGGWTAECRSLRESGDAIRKFDVAYFAASTDDADTNRKFAESLGADYPILSDPDREAATAYGVATADRPYAKRWTFYIGADGRILYIDREVNPATAGDDVARRLEALGIPEREPAKP